MTTGKDPAKGSRRPNLNGFADQFGMTNFRSEETRRHDGMAEVEGSKWFTGTMRFPSAPPNVLFADHQIFQDCEVPLGRLNTGLGWELESILITTSR